MAALPAGFIDRLRAEVSLAALASRWVTWDLKKSAPAKGDYWGSCPFHPEKTSSFHVDEKKGFYYCFGCHAKGDIVSLVRELDKTDFLSAVRRIAFVAGLDEELKGLQMPPYEPPSLIELKEIIVENFKQENFLEVGVMTGWLPYIQSHNRLLRSLSWGDPDYPGHVLDLLAKMSTAGDDSIKKVEAYLNSKFSDQVAAASEVVTFSEAQRSLGYKFVRSRNDIIGVMMPFQGSFGPVYASIQAACSETPLPAKRADEVWNNSVLINDILELINHSAVVICDLTGRNENVFYELGIAHAWGKPVIPITQSADDVPFDLRHHRYLHYLNNDEGRKTLQQSLAQKLKSLVGQRSPFR